MSRQNLWQCSKTTNTSAPVCSIKTLVLFVRISFESCSTRPSVATMLELSLKDGSTRSGKTTLTSTFPSKTAPFCSLIDRCTESTVVCINGHDPSSLNPTFKCECGTTHSTSDVRDVLGGPWLRYVSPDGQTSLVAWGKEWSIQETRQVVLLQEYVATSSSHK